MSEPLVFEDVAVGEKWTSPCRTVTETDVVNFAGMTGDYNPLHVDHEHASKTAFGRPIAHGLLGLSWVAGLGSHSPFMSTRAFVGVSDWKFMRPVFIGDTLHVETEATEKRPSGRKSGHITWRRRLVNQNGEVVQEGLFETLVALRTRIKDSPLNIKAVDSPISAQKSVG